MAYVQHPAFPDDRPFEVDDPKPWVEQGWNLLTDKKAAEVDPTVEPAGKKTSTTQ